MLCQGTDLAHSQGVRRIEHAANTNTSKYRRFTLESVVAAIE
ncbi:hypothetical protein TSAR_016434 [Trichomalopsis sarcophagae]|uniref:Uncharacterized protein n=1 Tax=Trichomalopsis sarcophagae TaxID=543379 RepID=A0A232EGC5_9HYME|nr:hypothetical protein TSAR_016434 [Trichomalopsis sarcophagae]